MNSTLLKVSEIDYQAIMTGSLTSALLKVTEIHFTKLFLQEVRLVLGKVPDLQKFWQEVWLLLGSNCRI